MNMVDFGYFLALALIAMIVGVRGYRVLRTRGVLRTDAGPANPAPSGRYI